MADIRAILHQAALEIRAANQPELESSLTDDQLFRLSTGEFVPADIKAKAERVLESREDKQEGGV